MGRRSRAVVGALALVCGSVPCAARGQGSVAAPTDQDKAAATALYEGARALLASGRVGEACRKLEESRRLDPLPGTVLNLAACHEREGLTASAAAEFRDARAMAQHDGRADRVAFAEAHLRALEPRLSTLVIVVDEDTADLQVTRDGVVLGRAAWRTRIPVDPGTHVVVATAPGRVARRIEIHVGSEGDTQTARIPPLEEAAPAPPPVVAPPPAAAVLPSTLAPVVPVRTGLSTRRSWAVATAGLGVVGVGAGAWLGARAIQKHGDPGSQCTTSPCSATSVSLNDEAKAAADGSTVAFAVGAAALAVGAWLWFGDSVSVTASAARLDVTGRF